MSRKQTPDMYSDKQSHLLQASLSKSTSYLELISQIKSELSEKRAQIMADISTGYHIVLEKVEFERNRAEDWVGKEFDVKLSELTRLESELTELKKEVVELVDQDTQFNSTEESAAIHETNSIGEEKVTPSEDTFENRFLSLDSIDSLLSYLSKLSFKKFDVPHYQFEMDQLSLSSLLTGRLVPEGVRRFERDYSSIELPIRYLGVQTTEKMSKSLLQDVAVDSGGQIYALDRGNCQIHIFDANLKYKYSFGQKGNEVGEFLHPWSIVYCNHTNRVIVSDCIQSTVQSFDLERHIVQRIKLGCVEQYSQLGGVCVDERGVIFVVSCWENCVKVYSDKFKFLREFGKTELIAPKDVKVWKDEIIVLEAIQPHFRLFSATGSHLCDINTSTLLSNPWYFCIDTLSEQILVTEFSKHQVRVIAKDGNISHTFGGDLFSFPAGIVIDKNKKVFVCDSMHLRLAVF